MRKDLQARQERMRQRAGKVPNSGPAPVWNPIDYSKRVDYLSPVMPLQHCPAINGVYLLAEGGLYYVGQSIDVPARIAGHRLKPCGSQFKDPHGVLLAEVPLQDGLTWAENARTRLHAEARFIAAALSLGLTLTNKISKWKKDKLAATFTDITDERSRIARAIDLILC